jgi:hypothetical protein
MKDFFKQNVNAKVFSPLGIKFVLETHLFLNFCPEICLGLRKVKLKSSDFFNNNVNAKAFLRHEQISF